MKKNHPNWLNEIKVAVVYEPLYKMGGGELHMRYILEAFPNSELFTAYYDEDLVKKNFKNTKIKSSFLQKLP